MQHLIHNNLIGYAYLGKEIIPVFIFWVLKSTLSQNNNCVYTKLTKRNEINHFKSELRFDHYCVTNHLIPSV